MNELFPTQTDGLEKVKGFCRCGAEVDCVIKVFSNGTRHAWGTCHQCGLTNAKQQRVAAKNLDDVKHRLMGLFSAVNGMPKGVDRDEAVAMIERLADDLRKEEY